MKSNPTVIAEIKKEHIEGYCLYYRLSETELESDEGKRPSYFIYASISHKSMNYFDETTVWDLTSDIVTAQCFFNSVAEGSATPITLLDIAEDFLAVH